MSNGARLNPYTDAAIESELHRYQSRLSAVRSLIADFEAITSNASEPRIHDSAKLESKEDTKSHSETMATNQKTNEDEVVAGKEEVKEDPNRRLVVSQLLYNLGYPFTRPPTTEEVAQEEKNKMVAAATARSAVVEGKNSTVAQQAPAGKIGVGPHGEKTRGTVSKNNALASSRMVYNMDGAVDDIPAAAFDNTPGHVHRASVTTTKLATSTASNTTVSKPAANSWNGMAVFDDYDDTTDDEGDVTDGEVEISAHDRALSECKGEGACE